MCCFYILYQSFFSSCHSQFWLQQSADNYLATFMSFQIDVHSSAWAALELTVCLVNVSLTTIPKQISSIINLHVRATCCVPQYVGVLFTSQSCRTGMLYSSSDRNLYPAALANSSNKHEACQLVTCCHRIETKRANAWVRLHTCFYAHEPSRTTSVIWEIERRDLSLLATLLRNVIVQPLFVLAFLLATVRAASQDFLWLQRIVFCQLSVIRASPSRELSLLAISCLKSWTWAAPESEVVNFFVLINIVLFQHCRLLFFLYDALCI